MTTKREYAISLGLAKPGRGRLSAEAHAAIQKAMGEGVVFSDSTPTSPAQTTKAPKDSKTPSETVIAPTAVVSEPNGYKFFYIDDKGKRRNVSERTACYSCGYSVGWHYCDTPKGITKDGLRDLAYE